MIIPDRMAHLERDPRGYPIPAIVLRTADGRAHFTINDDRKVRRCAKLKLCGICGKRLPKGEYWFVGGPMSAFHERGAYLDGPVHHECGTFALQTCPYLAAPHYGKRIDDRTIQPGTLKDKVILVDNTMLPDRPEEFIFACTKAFRVHERPGASVLFIPKRPWLRTETWIKGVRQ